MSLLLSLRIGCGLTACCLLSILPAGAQQADTTATAVSAAESPAGKECIAWLAAINSGNRETVRQFIATHFVGPPDGSLPVDRIAGRHLGIYQSTGGLELGKITLTSPGIVMAYVRSKRTGDWMSVRMAVAAQPPYGILGFGFGNSEAPADLLPNKKLTEQEIRDRIDALIARLTKEDKFSGVILVAKDGRPVYERACGMADRTWNIPNNKDTRFNIASIGKMFTAVAVAQLVEQGKLSYEDTLAKILPDYPNQEIAQKITVHHLLTHTSGLKEGNGKGLDKEFRHDFHTLKEYWAPANDSLKFEPGTKLEYNNYAYLVLGAIIEKVSGQDYYDYIREHIYKPAGMSHSDCYELDTEPSNLATGYMDAPGGTRRSNAFMLPIKGLPYGLGYATAGDLVRFATALREHKLCSAKTLDTVWTGRADYTERGSQYGYGCIVKQYNGTRIIGHGGGWFGITNKFDMYPDLGYTVVILNNIDSDPNAIAFKLREWLAQGQNPSGAKHEPDK